MELATPFVGNERDVRELIERLAVPARTEFNTHIPDESSARVPLPHFTVYVPPDPQRYEKEYNALKTLQSRRSHCLDEAIWTQSNRNILDAFDDKVFLLFAQNVIGDLHGDDIDLPRTP